MANDPALINEILRKSQVIAVVGLSDKPWRASHNIGRYLVTQGYHVFPVNPNLREVLGLECYPDLETADAAAKEDYADGIDLVDVFRASDKVAPIVDDVVRFGIPYLWLQEGVINDKAIARARSAGIKCVQDVCIFREHAQRVG
jgi:predicted CoA-binding protein